jgi:hypothetical protein
MPALGSAFVRHRTGARPLNSGVIRTSSFCLCSSCWSQVVPRVRRLKAKHRYHPLLAFNCVAWMRSSGNPRDALRMRMFPWLRQKKVMSASPAPIGLFLAMARTLCIALQIQTVPLGSADPLEPCLPLKRADGRRAATLLSPLAEVAAYKSWQVDLGEQHHRA